MTVAEFPEPAGQHQRQEEEVDIDLQPSDRPAESGQDRLDAMLAFAIARRWPGVFSNALEPGWVPTKMGGPGAPDDMDQAHRTQVWLAAGEDAKARVTGGYFYHLKPRAPNPQAQDPALQDRLLALCAELSGIAMPAM